MYKPNNSRTLAEAEEPQKRVGIQGYSGTGKTWSALTFPNPVVINIDRGLGAHIGRTDVIELPFYSAEFCKKVNRNHKDEKTLQDTIIYWLLNEGKKLERDQTLIVDGGTGLQNSYHKWYSVNQVYTKLGKVDDYAEWKLKVQ